MLGFLVTSDVRRRLLTVLFNRDGQGSLEELAEQAKVGRASAHRELRKMGNLGLVVSDHSGPRETFSASKTAPAELLRQLVKSRSEAPAVTTSVRRELRTLGAPLTVEPSEVKDLERVLVLGVKESHAEANLATTLPLAFVGAAKRGLDPARLLRLSRDAGEKPGVGFFLAMTAKLTGDHRYRLWSQPFRDRRRRCLQPYFYGETLFTRELAEKRTPPLARSWGFRMNMPQEAFETAFQKHKNG